ncbi:Asp23/Gls24 family envelope stress response protein [Streptomyces zagrosensis]|uniref:Putative alkaline shock family protein YloU n=1 Tax=Streptomyces zagrosensis TaxID=1042984 RepID=A0A7W9Q6T8_9ACTN|nr:Asp23/Gls24 family envelope stress response protein [Streptomyces zagrosensis]MBB5933777.1 putative alkaline shock family protein YloU [Streptomyces zagrosensis]
MTIPAPERGATTLTDRALSHTATGAAREALQHLNNPTATAHATGTTRRGKAHLTLSLTLPYPLDLPTTTATIQRHVTHRTQQLTGLPIATINVRIEHLVLPQAITGNGRGVQ